MGIHSIKVVAILFQVIQEHFKALFDFVSPNEAYSHKPTGFFSATKEKSKEEKRGKRGKLKKVKAKYRDQVGSLILHLSQLKSSEVQLNQLPCFKVKKCIRKILAGSNNNLIFECLVLGQQENCIFTKPYFFLLQNGKIKAPDTHY